MFVLKIHKVFRKILICLLIHSFLIVHVSVSLSSPQDINSKALDKTNLAPSINLSEFLIKDKFLNLEQDIYVREGQDIISSLTGFSRAMTVESPCSGENLAVGIGKQIEIKVLIRLGVNISDPSELKVILNSNIYDENWSDLEIAAQDIKNVYDEYLNVLPGIFEVSVKINPLSVGNYKFKIGAKLDGQENFVFQPDYTYLQVQLVPGWFDKNSFHPTYIFLPDVASLGYKLNWTGIRVFIEDMAKETGKNVFMLSPFFPTPGESPFTPLSVFAISPKLIDWNSVEERGDRPIEKYISFMKNKNNQRYKNFEEFSKSREIQNYARLIQKRMHTSKDVFYGADYNLEEFNQQAMNKQQIIEYLVYEQFICFEQFGELLKNCKKNNIRVLGDMPFYRAVDGTDAEFNNQYFDARNGDILSPGFKGGNDQIWGDLAAWNEHWIKEQVAAGKKDPRMLPFEYWNEIFAKVFDIDDINISGWRLDALHFYGRGSYEHDAERLYYDTALWDNLADYFRKHELLAVVEQLGGDGHAYNNFERLGFFQYAFILDLKPKSLNDLISEIEKVSRGAAFTVADTHDSWRWAKEYQGMFEGLTGVYNTAEDENKRIQMFNNVGPLFLAILMLGPKTETTLLSLGEYATEDNVKTEEHNDQGVVIGSKWGTKHVGPVDLSHYIKKFISIRQKNKAISDSSMKIIANNDQEHLISIAKTAGNNDIIVMGNFSFEKRKIKCMLPFKYFQINTASKIGLTDLMTGEIIQNAGPVFEYEFSPGQVAVFKVESMRNDALTWIKEYYIKQIKDADQRIYAQANIDKIMENDKFYSEQGISLLIDQISSGSSVTLTEWNWEQDKNKELMIGPQSALKVVNEKPFFIYVYDRKTGEEKYVPSFRLKGQNKYMSVLFGLSSSRYKFTFIWPQKNDNFGWEGKDYFLTVLPEAEQIGQKNDIEHLGLIADKQTINKYPHNTLTLSNGIGSILRLPLQPLIRNQGEDVLEVAGHVSKYDGFQANLRSNSPDESRRVLFRGTVEDVKIVVKGQEKLFNLNLDNMESFNMYPIPTWRFVIEDQGERLVIEKTAVLVQNENRFIFNYRNFSSTEGIKDQTLYVRPDIDMRMHHEVTKHWQGALEHWGSKHKQNSDSGCRIFPINDDWRNWYPGFEGMKMSVTKGKYTYAPEWHYSPNPIEAERGQDAVSDAYSPGFFTIDLPHKESSSFVFSSIDANTKDADLNEFQVLNLISDQIELQKDRLLRISNLAARNDSFVQKMVLGLWQFIAKRDKFYTVIAGYPWFSDWGRDTFICFDGLLSAGMDDIAKGLILVFGKFENNGMLPNIITGETAGNWDTVDAPLLYVLSVRNYIQATNDHKILDAYAGDRTIRQIVESIVNGYMQGTSNGIKMDDVTKLIWSPSHFTWMDTNYPACTPRQGYTVENNARWFDVLKFAAEISVSQGKSNELENISEQVKGNFAKYFWTNEKGGYLADIIEANQGKSAEFGKPDLAIRQNQLIAVLSYHELLSDQQKQCVVKIVQDKLLVPGALRTLSEDSASSEQFPYQGVYFGDEDSQRKPAYHNGTAWPHLFGDWALAYINAFGSTPENIRYVLSYFSPIEEHLETAGLGSVSEIIDGNAPHYPRGCDAQAWSIANNLAAYMKIRYPQNNDMLQIETTGDEQKHITKAVNPRAYSTEIIDKAI